MAFAELWQPLWRVFRRWQGRATWQDRGTWQGASGRPIGAQGTPRRPRMQPKGALGRQIDTQGSTWVCKGHQRSTQEAKNGAQEASSWAQEACKRVESGPQKCPRDSNELPRSCPRPLGGPCGLGARPNRRTMGQIEPERESEHGFRGGLGGTWKALGQHLESTWWALESKLGPNLAAQVQLGGHLEATLAGQVQPGAQLGAQGGPRAAQRRPRVPKSSRRLGEIRSALAEY